MVISRLTNLLKVGGIFTAALVVAGELPVHSAELLFDRGLPAENLNIEPDPQRSNIRWRGGVENERFYGDDFILGNPGERYVINHIRTWAVLGYREEGPPEPDEVGDWFSQIRLLGGGTSDERLAVLASSDLTTGSSTPNNTDIVITQVSYPDTKGSAYFNFGPTIPIWQIDFYNLNWAIEGGIRYNFSVQGIGRQFLDTDHNHVWYNHASNAALSGVPQQAADDLMSVFSNTGEFLGIADGEDFWNKSTDLNIQIFGEALETPEITNNNDDELTLVQIVHNLNDAGFLTGKAYHRALREVEQGLIEVRSHLLQKLAYQGLSGRNVIIQVAISPSEIEDFSEEDWQALRNSLNASDELSAIAADFAPPVEMADILDQLNETGILSERIYKQLHNKIKSGDLVAALFLKSRLYQAAADQMRLEEALDPELVKPRLNALKEAEIISSQGYTALMQALEASELQSPTEFLNYIDQALVVDLRRYSLDPEIYFPEIHESIAQMLQRTDLIKGEFGPFSLELVLDQVYERNLGDFPDLSEGAQEVWRTYKAVVSVQINGHDYQQASYYSPPDSEQDFIGRIEDSEFIHLFNKILRDQASPYRLYSVQDFYPFIDDSRFGVIALTETQANLYWGWEDWSEANHETTFTSDRIEEILTLFKDIDLLDHLSEAEIAEGRTHIDRSYITDPYQLLSAFKNVALFFDWESAEPDSPYERFLGYLAKISRGNFTPVDIEDGFDWENQSASLAFTLNGNRYSTELAFNGDWLDPQFFKFIEDIAATEALQGRFYPLSYGYGTEGYIFLNNLQLEALRSQQIITLASDEES